MEIGQGFSFGLGVTFTFYYIYIYIYIYIYSSYVLLFVVFLMGKVEKINEKKDSFSDVKINLYVILKFT